MGDIRGADVATLRSVIAQKDEYIARLAAQVEEQARQHAELRDFIAEERQVRQEVMDESEREAAGLRMTVTATQEVKQTIDAHMQCTRHV